MGDKSVLNVSNTTFKNNAQRSTSSILKVHHPLYINLNVEGGGGAIYLYKSVLNISKSTFENNVAIMVGGAIQSENSSINMEYSKFENNSILNKEIGQGGCLFLFGNSAVKISNVLFSKCHASNGGAIASNSTTIIMSNSSVNSNTGSAIYLSPGDSFEINNCTFFNNSTPQTGGAIVFGDYCVVKNSKYEIQSK